MNIIRVSGRVFERPSDRQRPNTVIRLTQLVFSPRTQSSQLRAIQTDAMKLKVTQLTGQLPINWLAIVPHCLCFSSIEMQTRDAKWSFNWLARQTISFGIVLARSLPVFSCCRRRCCCCCCCEPPDLHVSLMAALQSNDDDSFNLLSCCWCDDETIGARWRLAGPHKRMRKRR